MLVTSNYSMNFSTFFYTPKSTHMCVLFYLARHVVATHLERSQKLVVKMLPIFGTAREPRKNFEDEKISLQYVESQKKL